MQLVMASRVKAEPKSDALQQLNAAAKNVSSVTGNLVATAHNCRDKVSQCKYFIVFLHFDKLFPYGNSNSYIQFNIFTVRNFNTK